MLLPAAPRPGSGPRACPSSLAGALAAPGATAVGARPQRSRGRRGRGAKFANNTAERVPLSAQTLASSSGRGRSRTAVGQRGRTVAPGPGAPPLPAPAAASSSASEDKKTCKEAKGSKEGKKKAKPIGDRPRLRPPPRPAAALHQKALRPGQPPPSAPAWGWTPASSLTSSRPPCLPSPPQGGWEALRLSPVLQGRRGYGKFGDPGKGGPHPGLGAGDASSTFTTGPWRRALSKRHGICVL